MKTYGRALWMTGSIFTLLIFACVTINIYFPAEKVESVAAEIVDEIRDQKSRGDDSLLLRDILLAFACPSAWAGEALTVSNPTIRALKQRMKARYAQMKPYYLQGVLKEESDGFVSMGDTAGLGLKEKRDLKGLVSAENGDRQRLYKEIAKALKIDPGQVNKIAEIFAREWQKPVR
ncbi:MAG: DUF1318 domain-containing protein [Deltaproteobacteria bacterium]|nr:DUF1318 domain-containing protein [Deltaproteobacteria bacterium]MBW2354534.1 DUF1318 domain-containing protein [Deltaproteobacteria bacterium]HDZ90078.1 DUF1318 domain-containing protein [Deltaproteobacteria bacterium]